VSALNTVEYFFAQRTTSLAAATRHDFSAVTLTVAETAGRTFKNVFVEVTAHTDGAGSLTSWLTGIKLGGVAFSDTTVTDSTAFAAEVQSYKLVSGNLASYFNTNFGSGATQTCQVGVQFGGTATINIAAKLVIEYEHDWESNATRTKTVCIPLESSDTYLTTVLTQIGTNQVPQLTGTGGFLKEASVAVKNMAFEVETVMGSENTTNAQLALALDAEAEVADGVHNQAAISNYHYRRIWVRDDMSTTTTHQFKARSIGKNAWFKTSILLYVTYTYDEATTTAVTNSLRLPFQVQGLLPHTTEGYAYADVEVDIQDPATVTLLQSGVQLYLGERYGTTQMQIKVGAQAARGYYVNTVPSGQNSSAFTHRIDSGGVQGAFGTLARGRQTVRVQVATNAGFDGLVWNVSGVLIVNYSSGKSADTYRNTRTLRKQVLATTDNGASSRFASHAIDVPAGESWRLLNYAALTVFLTPNSQSVSLVDTETSAGLFMNLWSDYIFANGNLGLYCVWSEMGRLFRRYAADPDTSRADPTAAHDLRFCTTGDGSSAAAFVGFEIAWTIHSHTYGVSGTVSGYTSGDGSGIAVQVFDASHNLVATAMTTAGGAFSATVYDNTVQVYASAFVNSNLKGRSALATPGSSFSFRLSGTAPSLTSPSPASGTELVSTTTPVTFTVTNPSGSAFALLIKFVNESRTFLLYDFERGFAHPFTTSTVDDSDLTAMAFILRQAGGWQDDIEEIYISGVP
jgi:hypothetical protein